MRRAAIGFGVALLGWALAAPASDRALPPPGGDGWEPLTFPRIERTTRYERVDEDGVAAVRAVAECSASGLLHPLGEADLDATPRLRWRWRVERGLEIADERAKEGDDFAARVYVVFRFDPERAGWLERAQRRVASALYDRELPGDAINYVWASGEPAGAAWDNPYTAASKMVSLGRGPLPAWRTETVDVRADYRRLFGAEPPPLAGLAVMSDSDDSCGEAAAWFADFQLLGPEPGDEGG